MSTKVARRNMLALVALLSLGLSAQSAAQHVSPMAKSGSGCWDCQMDPNNFGLLGCVSAVPGYWNCWSVSGGCGVASWGCGAGAYVPVDADGTAQYVTRPSTTDPDVTAFGAAMKRRPCDGVIVAWRMTLEEALAIRRRTIEISI